MILLIVMLAKNSAGTSSAGVDSIIESIGNAADKEKMQEGDNRMLRRLYGIDPEQLEGMVLYYPSSNMGAEEVLFVRVKDDADTQAVRTLIEQRNETQIHAFEGYGVEQTQLLNDAEIKEYGRDIIYAVGDKNKSCIKAYEDL